MSSMTDKGSARTGQQGGPSNPKKGEHFRCQQCGMEVQVTNECKCNDPNHVRFECCGQQMRKQ